MDGMDAALVGHIMRCGSDILALYSYEKLIEVHIEAGMDYEGAVEFIDFNQAGAYVGENTPFFLIDGE